MNFLAIVVGGGIGAASRYALSRAITQMAGINFPIGTITINLIGCFVAGLLCGIFDKVLISQNIRLFIIVGILGGFTTFSAFGVETIMLLRSREFPLAVANVLISTIGGLGLAFIGFWISDLIPLGRG